MELLANEQFFHVLVQQISQTVLVQEAGLELGYKARKDAELTPFKDAKLHVKILFVAFQSLDLRLRVLDLRRQFIFLLLKLFFPFLPLFDYELVVVIFHSYLLLFKQSLSGPLLLI